jgi:hypothetical protein
MGERVTCALLRGAGETSGHGLDYWNQYERCPLFTNDVLLPDGEDTRAPTAPTGGLG